MYLRVSFLDSFLKGSLQVSENSWSKDRNVPLTISTTTWQFMVMNEEDEHIQGRELNGHTKPVVTNLFEPKIPDLRLRDRQDQPIEALRENDCPDWTYNLRLFIWPNSN